MTPDPQVHQGGEAIRTWTLEGWDVAAIESHKPGESTKVIELEPVLKMLARSTHGSDVAVFDGREIISFLREHGRLP